MLQVYRKAQSAGAAPAAAAASSSSGRGVTAVAVLDDFTIVGQPAAALAAMDCFMAECERIGLAVNRAKCVVLCPERHGRPDADGSVQGVPAAVQRWCERVGIPLSPERFVGTLGSVVGRDTDGMKRWAADQVSKHDRFFTLVPKLKKQMALQVLRVAGVPRFNHIVRSLPPRVTDKACALFDEKVMATFQAIAGFDHSELKEPVVSQAQLPLKMGGGGLRSYARNNAAAYLGSVALAAEFMVPAEALVCARLLAADGCSSSSSGLLLRVCCPLLPLPPLVLRLWLPPSPQTLWICRSRWWPDRAVRWTPSTR
jgi:hypothetical protein